MVAGLVDRMSGWRNVRIDRSKGAAECGRVSEKMDDAPACGH